MPPHGGALRPRFFPLDRDRPDGRSSVRFRRPRTCRIAIAYCEDWEGCTALAFESATYSVFPGRTVTDKSHRGRASPTSAVTSSELIQYVPGGMPCKKPCP